MSGRKIYDRATAGRLLQTPRGHVPLTGPLIRPVVAIWIDEGLGLLSVEHDGNAFPGPGGLSFDALQALKNLIWGREAVAIEVYPPASRLIDNVAMRHLWLLGADDFWPDLGREGRGEPRRLIERYALAADGRR